MLKWNVVGGNDCYLYNLPGMTVDRVSNKECPAITLPLPNACDIPHTSTGTCNFLVLETHLCIHIFQHRVTSICQQIPQPQSPPQCLPHNVFFSIYTSSSFLAHQGVQTILTRNTTSSPPRLWPPFPSSFM